MKSKICIEFGHRIKLLRKKYNISQELLAEKAGVHRTYIGMVERAEKNITLENIYKLSKAFAIPLSELFMEVGSDD